VYCEKNTLKLEYKFVNKGDVDWVKLEYKLYTSNLDKSKFEVFLFQPLIFLKSRGRGVVKGCNIPLYKKPLDQ
jgi:hypothetical protein